MKPTFSIIIMLSVLTLAGCATPYSEYDKAREINSINSYEAYLEKYPYGPYSVKAKDKIAELKQAERERQRVNQIKQNWDKLRKGMSVDEVDNLIGPLDRGAVISIRNLAQNNTASSGVNNAPKAEGGFPYRGLYFTLQFDATGKLSEWLLTVD